jgi:MFS family permease
MRARVRAVDFGRDYFGVEHGFYRWHGGQRGAARVAKNLNATVLDVRWVIESYALFLAVLLLAGGSMGDRFGRRRIFCSGVALFALASIGCGLAGALLVPGSLAIKPFNRFASFKSFDGSRKPTPPRPDK